MSFCEIKKDAALVVAEAVADKASLEKLDLNGETWVAPSCSGRLCPAQGSSAWSY